MILISKHSDKKQERRWHVALCMLGGCIGLLVTGLFGESLIVSMVALSASGGGDLYSYNDAGFLDNSYVLYVRFCSSGRHRCYQFNRAARRFYQSPALIRSGSKTSTGSIDYGLYTYSPEC